MSETLSASLAGVERQVAECSRLHSSGCIPVFAFQCGFVVETLSQNLPDRLRRYNLTLGLLEDVVVGAYEAEEARQRMFKSVAFCIESLSELARQLQSVVALLMLCCQEDWWIPALELSVTRPELRTPRWSFELSVKWSDMKSAMVLLLDGQVLCEPGGRGRGGTETKGQTEGENMARRKLIVRDTRNLETKDATALITELIELKANHLRLRVKV